MRWAIILIASAVAALGQIDNPPSSVNITDATTTGRAVLTASSAAAAATAIGLGATNYVAFSGVEIISSGDELQIDGQNISSIAYGHELNFEENRFTSGTNNLFGWTTTNVNVVVPATFSTNVTISGTLTAASIATSTPVSWSLDAVQTAAGTNGVLDLPLTANVLRITNANTISAITNGRLGAFYYIVNQSGTNLVLSNSSTLTTRGGGTVTLAPNQSATLLSTSATNATLQGGPSQLDSPTFAGLTATGNVTMSGTANTAPNQTAASGSSVMTRDLVDKQTLQLSVRPPNTGFYSYLAGGTTAASNGATVSQGFFIRCNPQNATNNVVRWRDPSILPVALGFGASGAINFSNNLEFGMTALFGANASTNATARVFFGGTNGYISGTTIARHVGWRADASNNVYATHANGTNYTEVLVTNTTQTMKWWHIAANNGFVVWSIDGTQVASATNGPTGSEGTGSGNFITVSETTAASIIYWDIYQIFTRRNP